ncbi:undecaprenyl/decaprenyl-phosphate alpha-N-acetylglucosaminyl 1-phosphate transferase [Candidatus Parcubacteria bacterium]|nr:undecaprenyl/decaprenyl-phosphate alpha-N-acetylglucosaminyl 1-phosphate transferase [Patescibacteria group bacterium]MCG2689431.1 undecaprenyl/decaprenyl-phosphate alpha-N-acetylglucosaminyl 1-phosphate transferase [Candidatus Parcubacteria bacterium]
MMSKGNWVKNLNIPFVVSFILLALSAGFAAINFNYLPPVIGIFFNRPWGTAQLGYPKDLLYILGGGAMFLFVNFLLYQYFSHRRKGDLAHAISIFSLVVIFIHSLFLTNIVFKSSTKIFYLNLESLRLIIPWLISFVATYLVSKKVVSLAKKYGFMEDPSKYAHPSAILTKATPRAGALAFTLVFIMSVLVFCGITKANLGIILGVAILTILGLADDKKKYINPKARLALQFVAAGVVVAAGIGISYIGNPFGATIMLDKVVIPIQFLGEHKLILFADIFALIWIVFLSNAVSWSNGIDGQFAGFSGITALVIALASLKTAIGDNDPTQMNVARLAIITSGCAFGMTAVTWYPQKILWGFGATAVGLVIGALSILSLSKVYIVALVLAIPLFDAIVTGVRRILQKKSPFGGDRGHLHHRLIDLGWSKPKVAMFYWLATAILGLFAVVGNESDADIDVIRLGVGIVCVVVLLNLIVERGKTQLLQVAKKRRLAKEPGSDESFEN